MMLRLGIDNSWIYNIKQCKRSVTFSILVNGEPKRLIKPSRGLRQGGPLSPYLFLACKECLIDLLREKDFDYLDY